MGARACVCVGGGFRAFLRNHQCHRIWCCASSPTGRETWEIGKRNDFDDVGRVRINTPVAVCGEEEREIDSHMRDIIGVMGWRHSLMSKAHVM
jgi:hypothetical protein